MKRFCVFSLILVIVFVFAGCDASSTSKERSAVDRQQGQYLVGQPIPAFNWSLERHLVVELYKLRNQRVATHAVWRSDYGMIEGDCPSMGYGIPYDTSLTAPLKLDGGSYGYAAVDQAEPNGIFASKNTAATWVFCLGKGGKLEPVYVESKVTIFPGPVKVDYEKNRVIRSGAATVLIQAGK